jgi:hypothetical protein
MLLYAVICKNCSCYENQLLMFDAFVLLCNTNELMFVKLYLGAFHKGRCRRRGKEGIKSLHGSKKYERRKTVKWKGVKGFQILQDALIKCEFTFMSSIINCSHNGTLLKKGILVLCNQFCLMTTRVCVRVLLSIIASINFSALTNTITQKARNETT